MTGSRNEPRILFLSGSAYAHGGVERWLEDLSSGLAARGWNVHVGLASGEFHDPDRFRSQHPVPNPTAIEPGAGFREHRTLAVVRMIQRLSPEVVLPVNLADGLFGAVLAKRCGIPFQLATCLHGQSDALRSQVELVAPAVDLAAAVSRRVASLLDTEEFLYGRVRHIPAGVPPPVLLPVPRKELRTIGYVGRLDQDEKRAMDLIPFVRGLAAMDIRARIVGSGPCEAELRRELEPLAVSGDVAFEGNLSRDNLYERFFPEIDALVVFSPAETGPLAAWEAMIHGAIPIVSDYLGRTEEGVIIDGVNSRVFRVGEIQEALQAVAATCSPNVVERLSREALTRLPKEYVLNHSIDQWDRTLGELILESPRDARDVDMPSLTTPGWLAPPFLGPRVVSRLRVLLGRRNRPADPGSEWPSLYSAERGS